MFNCRINVLALFFATACTSFADSSTEEVPCVIPSRYSARNSSGICRPLKDCPAAIGLLKAGIKPTSCPNTINATMGEASIFCCPSKKRISSEKCGEFTRLLTQPVKAKEALMYEGGTSQEREADKTIKCQTFFDTFISGGRKAREQEYPYQVALGYGDKPDWRCGGTLIDPSYVLSAAHCGRTVFGPPKMVLLGDRKLSVRKDPSRLIVNISDVYLHPHFKPPIEYNDIALLKLASPVTLSRAILPACLPDPGDRLDRVLGVEATGWGQTSAFGGQSDSLQSTIIAKFDTKECTQVFSADSESRRRLPKGIIRSQFCAGDKNGYRDTCKGDSGGPVTVSNKNETCVHYIVGITSFGSKLCGFQQPGVYTNILSYLDWIEDIVWYNGSSNPKNSKLYTKATAAGELILYPTNEQKTTESPLPPTSTIQTQTEPSSSKLGLNNQNSPEVSSSTTLSSAAKDDNVTSTSITATGTPPIAFPTSPQSPMTPSLQSILMEATTNIPTLTQINDSYMSRISSSISSLLNNISIGR